MSVTTASAIKIARLKVSIVKRNRVKAVGGPTAEDEIVAGKKRTAVGL